MLKASLAKQPDSLPVKITLMAVSTLTVKAGATIAPSLPAMREHFAGVANADYWVRLVLTVPALFIALGAPFVGLIIDRLGRKPLLSLVVFVYGLAGSSGFLLNSLGLILLGAGAAGFECGWNHDYSHDFNRRLLHRFNPRPVSRVAGCIHGIGGSFISLLGRLSS